MRSQKLKRRPSTKTCLMGLIAILVSSSLISLWLLHPVQQFTPPNPIVRHSSEQTPLDHFSSVDYIACCGLGHRVIRMADAYFLASKLNFTLRSFWGWCGKDSIREVYTELFYPPSQDELLRSVTTTHQRVRLLNQVKGFRPIQRNATLCECQQDKIDSDYRFYKSLRDRFRARNRIDRFRKQHRMDEHFVIGLHIRAGNGEQGDFRNKQRQIDSPMEWANQVMERLRDFYTTAPNLTKPPLFYIATDTPQFIDLFRSALAQNTSTNLLFHNVPVIEWSQARPANGTGVFFGTAGQITNAQVAETNDCMQRWQDAMIDMILLSYADLIVSGRPSSFSQSMPMALAFGKTDRQTKQVYCEVIHDGYEDPKIHLQDMELACYSDYWEWCCNRTSINDSKPRKEFVHMIVPKFIDNQSLLLPPILTRPTSFRQCYPRPGMKAKQWCLPHQWEPF